MVGLDLTGVKRFVDRQIVVDDVEITRPVPVDETELDGATGELTPVDPVVLYAHLGVILPISASSPVEPDNTQTVPDDTDATYKLLLPSDAILEPSKGDLVRCTVSRTPTPDGWITRRRFRIAQLAEVSSFNVVRILYLEELARSNADVPPDADGPVFSGFGPPPSPPPSVWPVGSKYLDLLTNEVWEVAP